MKTIYIDALCIMFASCHSARTLTTNEQEAIHINSVISALLSSTLDVYDTLAPLVIDSAQQRAARSQIRHTRVISTVTANISDTTEKHAERQQKTVKQTVAEQKTDERCVYIALLCSFVCLFGLFIVLLRRTLNRGNDISNYR
jgi:CHASE3 domain sensor protein